MPRHRSRSRKPGFARGWALLLAGLAPAAQAATDLTSYSDFGRPEILLTAASILQTGTRQTARIDQVTDVSSTDRLLYPVGSGNIAEIEQSGSDNEALVQQTGNLNRLRVRQDGVGHHVDAIQLGVDNWLDVNQTGSFNVLSSYQEGVGNRISLTQTGGNTATLREVGDRNEISIQQVVGGAPISLSLVGSDQRVTITQH